MNLITNISDPMSSNIVYEIWRTGIFLENDEPLTYEFVDKNYMLKYINDFNRGKNFYEGDEILYYVEVKGGN